MNEPSPRCHWYVTYRSSLHFMVISSVKMRSLSERMIRASTCLISTFNRSCLINSENNDNREREKKKKESGGVTAELSNFRYGKFSSSFFLAVILVYFKARIMCMIIIFICFCWARFRALCENMCSFWKCRNTFSIINEWMTRHRTDNNDDDDDSDRSNSNNDVADDEKMFHYIGVYSK